MFMKDNGTMIKQKEKENLQIVMGLHMKETGKMINKMDLENKSGLMEHIMKDNFSKEKGTAQVK